MKILLADDDRHLREGLSALFCAEGFECMTAATGDEAYMKIKRFLPELCILDNRMPGLTGFEVCRALRNDEHHIPIIMLTACDTEVDQILGLNLGADDYITKPFSPKTLVARVKAIGRRLTYNQHQETAVLNLSGISICQESQTASNASVSVKLTPRELTFLQLLGNKPGVVFSKDTILDHCWGHHYLPSSRALDQFISTLRRKLEKELSADRIIFTVHGFGYRYVESLYVDGEEKRQ